MLILCKDIKIILAYVFLCVYSLDILTEGCFNPWQAILLTTTWASVWVIIGGICAAIGAIAVKFSS